MDQSFRVFATNEEFRPYAALRPDVFFLAFPEVSDSFDEPGTDFRLRFSASIKSMTGALRGCLTSVTFWPFCGLPKQGGEDVGFGETR